MGLLKVNMQKDKMISLPGPLFEELAQYHKQSIFPSLDDLIIYILQEYLDKQNTQQDNEKNDDKIVQDRLKNLGYL